MKIYLDTEFIEKPNHLELISIALVKEDGESYYAVSSEFNEKLANDWVREHVIPFLDSEADRKSLEEIREEVVEFIGPKIPEFWAYFAAFDWVLLTWLYGGMASLPYNFPFFCHDLKQEVDRIGFPEERFPQNPKKHHALWDARWDRELHRRLLTFEQEKKQ